MTVGCDRAAGGTIAHAGVGKRSAPARRAKRGTGRWGMYARFSAVATGSELVSTAGQVDYDARSNAVGAGDYAAEVEQAYLDVSTVLTLVGAASTTRCG